MFAYPENHKKQKSLAYPETKTAKSFAFPEKKTPKPDQLKQPGPAENVVVVFASGPRMS